MYLRIWWIYWIWLRYELWHISRTCPKFLSIEYPLDLSLTYPDHMYPYVSTIYVCEVIHRQISISPLLPRKSSATYLFISIFIHCYPSISMNIHHTLMISITSKCILGHCFISMSMLGIHIYPNSRKGIQILAKLLWRSLGLDTSLQVLMWCYVALSYPAYYCLRNGSIFTTFFHGHSRTGTYIIV